MEKSKIIERLQELNAEYKTAIQQVVRDKEIIEQEKMRESEVKNQIIADVVGELDENGKKKFTNQQARDVETERRLKEVFDNTKLLTVIEDMKKWEGIINICKFEQRSLLGIIELMKVD